MIKHFVIIDPDQISCFVTQNTISVTFQDPNIVIFTNVEEALIYLDKQDEETCILVENKNLDLSARELLSLFKELENKHFKLIILSNLIQEKLLSIIPKFFHVKFTYKPLTKERLKSLVKDW